MRADAFKNRLALTLGKKQGEDGRNMEKMGRRIRVMMSPHMYSDTSTSGSRSREKIPQACRMQIGQTSLTLA